MLRVRRVAYAGAIVMVGLTGCSASAETNPTGTPTPTASTPSPGTPTGTTTTTATGSPRPTTTTTRRTISVQLNPDRVTAGETSRVWILANCPVPTGGPAHTGTATSRAFINGVTLNPVPAASLSPSPTATAGSPWVRGEAQVSGTIRRGSYRVDVKCDGTNDLGRATLRVVAAETDEPNTTVPTRAPRAGGGGTFAQDASDESSIPLGPAGVLIALALAGGIGFAVKRRNRA
ncbi:hypothetical protein [Nonomuraea rubra]|uniref:Gram-positive cocci surface proteins LPxTG domain-containing protein n=1 Tax=Nonomuraea rubra TaxID=46180 RepID=A0A7X0P5M6_9ACTN|nr:hypothetical protein [Nonomuraea rubra]MBB6555728.1 hypothetical protein [Nonomuraea rubra]